MGGEGQKGTKRDGVGLMGRPRRSSFRFEDADERERIEEMRRIDKACIEAEQREHGEEGSERRAQRATVVERNPLR